MPVRKPRLTAPPPRYVPAPVSTSKLRRQADACRAKADALEAMLSETQDQFTEAFAAADSQRSTRDRITDEARRGRKLGARGAR